MLLKRIRIMVGIMSLQLVTFLMMAIQPAAWLIYFVMWWALSGFFWYQFIKAMRGE